MNRNRFIQGLKSDIQFSEKERQRIIRNSIKKYPWKLKCTVAMEELPFTFSVSCDKIGKGGDIRESQLKNGLSCQAG